MAKGAFQKFFKAGKQEHHFSSRDLCTALIKAKDLHEGLWRLVIKFEVRGTNVDLGDGGPLIPAAVVPLADIGIVRWFPMSDNDEPDSLTVDAAVVNPEPRIIQPFSIQ